MIHTVREEFDRWWDEVFHDEDWGRGIHDLVETAWTAGFNRHRELTRAAPDEKIEVIRGDR